MPAITTITTAAALVAALLKAGKELYGFSSVVAANMQLQQQNKRRGDEKLFSRLTTGQLGNTDSQQPNNSRSKDQVLQRANSELSNVLQPVAHDKVRNTNLSNNSPQRAHQVKPPTGRGL